MNAIDRLLLTDSFPEGSNELRMLRSLQSAHFTVFEVVETLPEYGVHGLDGPLQKPVFLVDVGIGRTARLEMELATRLHSPGEGWWMTTGAALPITDDAMQRIILAIAEHQRPFGVEPDQQERATITLRECLAAGASRHIRYDDLKRRAARSSATTTVSAEPKVGRNEPCPCGSGRKYKKCCGV